MEINSFSLFINFSHCFEMLSYFKDTPKKKKIKKNHIDKGLSARKFHIQTPH